MMIIQSEPNQVKTPGPTIHAGEHLCIVSRLTGGIHHIIGHSYLLACEVLGFIGNDDLTIEKRKIAFDVLDLSG